VIAPHVRENRALGNAITNSMDSLSGLSKDIEQIAQSMNKYFIEADKLSKYVNSILSRIISE
jgi:thiamine monophosphate kinase